MRSGRVVCRARGWGRPDQKALTLQGYRTEAEKSLLKYVDEHVADLPVADVSKQMSQSKVAKQM